MPLSFELNPVKIHLELYEAAQDVLDHPACMETCPADCCEVAIQHHRALDRLEKAVEQINNYYNRSND